MIDAFFKVIESPQEKNPCPLEISIGIPNWFAAVNLGMTTAEPIEIITVTEIRTAIINP